MRTDEILEIYDAQYTKSYDAKFLTTGYFKHVAEIEVDILRELLAEGARWLDVACGTGFFLSRFPGHPRAGLDISPAMLEQACSRNPDALFFREGNMKDPIPEWKGEWDVVSCMWSAYGYLDSMAEVKALITSFAEWTSCRGACFLPVLDIEDITGGSIPYCKVHPQDGPTGSLGGPFYATGFSWSWTDNEGGKKHENLIAPHADYLVELLEEHFDIVEIISYPPYLPGWRGRRAILATQKKGMAPTPMSRTVTALAAAYHPLIEQASDGAPPVQAAPESDLAGPADRTEHTGWLRRAWRKLPPEARRLVKAAFGES